MSRLSISSAWDETKGVIARDGRLLATVALALMALPSAISAVVNPDLPAAGDNMELGSALVFLTMSLIAMVGQLAIIRLAIGPSISVGGAIGHAARRAPAYLGSIVLLLLVALAVAVPVVLSLTAMGVKIKEGAALSGSAATVLLILSIVAFYFVVRMMLTSAVASSEQAGPIQILKRSWALTRGHVVKLLGFLLMFLIGAGIVLSVISLMTGLLARALFGEMEPLSAAALLAGLIQGLAGAVATMIFAIMLARIYLQLAAEKVSNLTEPSSGPVS